MRNANGNPAAISPEDKSFIYFLAGMPDELKILTRGIFIGLSLSEKIQQPKQNKNQKGATQ